MACKSLRVHPSAHYVKHSRDRSGIVLGDSELEVWQRLARYRLRGLSHDPNGLLLASAADCSGLAQSDDGRA